MNDKIHEFQRQRTRRITHSNFRQSSFSFIENADNQFEKINDDETQNIATDNDINSDNDNDFDLNKMNKHVSINDSN